MRTRQAEESRLGDPVHTGIKAAALSRPVAGVLRSTAASAVRVCIHFGIHPDIVSYLSIAVAAVGAACFWRATSHLMILLVVPVFLYLRLWLNMLDGMVARAAGRTSPRGAVVNELVDRAGDLVIFVGIAHSGLNAVASGYCAAIFALMAAYVRVFGQVLGAPPAFGGLMSKPWRMVWCHVGAWTTLASTWWSHDHLRYAGLTVLDWTCVVIVAGSIQTIYVRLAHITTWLQHTPPGARS